jgi:hypothetical protein
MTAMSPFSKIEKSMSFKPPINYSLKYKSFYGNLEIFITGESPKNAVFTYLSAAQDNLR